MARISLASLRLAAALFCLLPALVHAGGWGTQDLMKLLSQHKNGQATFVERKFIGIVDKPVESSGELFFTAPDRLEKRTLVPQRESMVLDGQKLRIERAGKAPLTLNLSDYPEAAAFVDSIRGTLAGDFSALDRVYQLNLSGSAAAWQLVLLPRYTRMSDIITRITIRGQRGEISAINFDLADGDRSEMTVTPVVKR